MASVTGLMITNAGQARIAADLSGGADLALSHVAWGDAAGNPADPNPAQMSLVRELYRAPIAAVAVVDGAIVLDAILPADTADAHGRASHGFSVSECGLFASDGTMIALARMGDGYKPGPLSGQAVVATYRLKLAVANPTAITVVIDPQAQVALGREVRPQWLTVDGIANAPPAGPATGATYAIGAAPTGAWTGSAGRIAQWIGMWSLATPPEGHRVNDRSKAENDPMRELKLIGGSWVSAAATDAAYGPTRIATPAEARAGLSRALAVCPADLVALAYTRPPGPTYYVNGVSGNDATNDGSTPQSAFKTLQGAVNAISSRYLTVSEINLIAAAADPPYAGVAFVRSFVPSWRLQLSPGAVIDAMSLDLNGGRGVIVGKGAQAVITGGAIRARYEALAVAGGLAELRDCALTLSTHPAACTVAGYEGGSVRLFGEVGVSGQGRGLLAAVSGATALIGYADDASQIAAHVSFAPGVQFTGAGVIASGGTVAVAPSKTTFGGAPLGQRYLANCAGGINVNGAGANFLPGSIAGLTDGSTGGWYV